MKSLKQYVTESANKFCVSYIHSTGNNTVNASSLKACYDILKRVSGLKYYDIHAGSNTSEIDELVEWGGEGGYWANRLESTAKNARDKREHDTIVRKQVNISKFA